MTKKASQSGRQFTTKNVFKCLVTSRSKTQNVFAKALQQQFQFTFSYLLLKLKHEKQTFSEIRTSLKITLPKIEVKQTEEN